VTDWNNKEEVLEAVEKDIRALKQASEELRADREVVLTAVTKNGHNLEYASKELCADKEVVLAAVNDIGYVLEYASEELRADKEVVLAAVKQNVKQNGFGFVLNYASDELINTPEIMKEVDLEALKLINDLYDYYRTRQTTQERLNKTNHPLKNCPKKFTSSKEFMLEAIIVNSYYLEFASDELKQDEELLLAAIKYNPLYYQEIPEDLITNKKLFYETAKYRFIDLLYSDEDFFQYDYFTDYWRIDYWWKYQFAAFCNDKDIANIMFEGRIFDSPCYYFDFFEFLGPMLNNDKNFLHSIYRQMATCISREHKGSMDCLDLEHHTLELSDKAIEGHLSGIKQYMKEVEHYHVFI